MAREVRTRNSPDPGASAALPRKSRPRRRTPKRGPDGRPFAPGTNSHDGTVHRRGPDLIPRGSLSLLYRTLLDADGATVASIEREKNPGYRVLLAKQFIKVAKDKSPRLALMAAEQIADRLEGKPVQSMQVSARRVTVFQGPQGEPESTAPAPSAPTSRTLAPAPVVGASDDDACMVPVVLPDTPPPWTGFDR